jgi:hypothetical protein
MSVLLALALAAAAPAKAAAPPPTAAETLIANCNAHKFETAIDVMSGGVPRKSKVKLCGKVGQSDSDWVATLRDAVAKTAADARMTASVKDQITRALNAEIARIEGRPTQLGNVVAGPLPSIAGNKRESIPSPHTPPPEYTKLPALPPPLPAVSVDANAPVPILLAAPRLTFSCFNAGDIGEGECAVLARDTLLRVRAGENLPAGTSLRFVRRGDMRAEVALALRKGQSVRMNLPMDVCRGVVGSVVELEVVRQPPGAASVGQVVDTLGPYELRC